MGQSSGRRAASWIVALGACAALGACSEGDTTLGKPDRAPDETRATQTDAAAVDPCRNYDCVVEMHQHFTGQLGAINGPSVEVIGSKCEEALFFGPLPPGEVTIRSPLCACMTDDDFAYYIGPELGGCAVRGHTHECVMQHGEFGVCDPSDPDACASVCSELQARLEADASTSKSVRVRSARCEVDNFEGSLSPFCTDAVVEVEDYCYPATPLLSWDRWQDCELDDDAVLSAPAPTLPYCDDIPPSTPSTADCLPVCDDASDCILALGCSLGPTGAGYGPSARPRCGECEQPDDCLQGETCAHGFCVLAANADCDLDSDCPQGQQCTPMGDFSDGEGRGNATLEVRCRP